MARRQRPIRQARAGVLALMPAIATARGNDPEILRVGVVQNAMPCSGLWLCSPTRLVS